MEIEVHGQDCECGFCVACEKEIRRELKRMPICKTFMGGLDDGPWLPGKGPRKRVKPKIAEELSAIRAKAWATRRNRLGPKGHR